MYKKTSFKQKKFFNNFFLLDQEKELIFALKKLHRLNNQVGYDNEPYTEFIEKMSCYYNDIVLQYTRK